MLAFKKGTYRSRAVILMQKKNNACIGLLEPDAFTMFAAPWTDFHRTKECKRHNVGTLNLRKFQKDGSLRELKLDFALDGNFVQPHFITGEAYFIFERGTAGAFIPRLIIQTTVSTQTCVEEVQTNHK